MNNILIKLNEKKDALFVIFLFFVYLGSILFAYMVFFWVPSDAEQGVAQRIFYYHVPTALVSFLGFFIAFIYCIQYLRTRDLAFDRKAAVYALAGWVFTTGVLLTGPLWAKPIWGDFWNWKDQRLISFFVLWMMYAGYLIFRMGIVEPHKRARFSAVLGIIAFMDVPLVYFSIRIWNTAVHPQAVLATTKKGAGLFDPSMKITFFFGMFLFLCKFFITAWVTARYYLLKQIQAEKEAEEN
ncbi:MAG: cytochrome c biogenesis protein [Spirochaetia bacterium]|nr:cytochrome c biogenesis protein [Spirochaetia bacterium]